MIFKPTYLFGSSGELARLPDGGITNIGGTNNPTFTVDGKGLLFADGTSTNGGAVNLATTLQEVYTGSNAPAQINLTSGKDFVLNALNSNKFIFDADTGLVTIIGDLVVSGTTTTVINTSVNTDRIEIHQTNTAIVPFLMEPIAGVVPAENVVDIKVVNGGPTIFSIDENGITYIENLVVPGTVNGVDLEQLVVDFNAHVELLSSAVKHTAAQVSADTSTLTTVTGNTVQEALESIDAAIGSISSIGNVQGYEHVQLAEQGVWIIAHNQNTRRIQLTVWTETDNTIIPDSVNIVDNNTVAVVFGTAMAGRAILMLF